MCRVDDVGVDQLEVFAELHEPFGMTLFHVLPPEVWTLEEFCAFGDFATVFVGIFLFDVL